MKKFALMWPLIIAAAWSGISLAGPSSSGGDGMTSAEVRRRVHENFAEYALLSCLVPGQSLVVDVSQPPFNDHWNNYGFLRVRRPGAAGGGVEVFFEAYRGNNSFDPETGSVELNIAAQQWGASPDGSRLPLDNVVLTIKTVPNATGSGPAQIVGGSLLYASSSSVVSASDNQMRCQWGTMNLPWD